MIGIGYAKLAALLEDVSYCERLTRRQIQYEMWYELYTTRGEIPGVKRFPRMVYNHFSVGVGFGLNFPAGEGSRVLKTGFMPTVLADYNLPYRWGVLSFGLLTGFNLQSTRDDVTYKYDLFSFPLGLHFEYSTNFNSPFF